MAKVAAIIVRRFSVFATLAVMAILASCGSEPTGPVRDQRAPISNQVDVTVERLVGDWVVRVSWPGHPKLFEYLDDPLYRPFSRLRIEETKVGIVLSGSKFVWWDDVGGYEKFSAELKTIGAGRFREIRSLTFRGAPLWVLWLDADNRTAAIGTPGGEFGWIMDRAPKGGADRIGAAKQIMQWSGYDMARMKE